jgi:hypothetical protein
MAGFAGVILNFLALATAMQLTSLLECERRTAQLAAFGQLWAALIIGSMLVVGGVFRHLTFEALLATHAALLVLSIASSRANPLNQCRRALKFIRDGWLFLRTDRVLLFTALAVTAAYLYVLAIGLLFPPFSGDALMYHLPIAASFVEQGNLQPPGLSGFWKSSLWAYYPANGSLLLAWFLMTGGDRLVDLVQLPFVLFFSGALFALCRHLRLSRKDAVWAVLLFVSIPLVISQAKTSLNDVVLAFFVLTTVFWLVSFSMKRPWQFALLAGLPAGMLLGMKPNGPVHVGLIAGIGVAFVLLQKEAPWPARFKGTTACLVVSTACLLVFGGFWYGRNWLQVGDPTYPLGLVDTEGFGLGRLFRNSVASLLTDQGNLPTVRGTGYYNYTVGAGIQVVAFIFPGLLLGFGRAVYEKKWHAAMLAGISMVGFFFWWMIAPVTSALRYGLGWLAIGIPLALLTVRAFKRFHKVQPLIVCTMVCYSSILAVPLVGSFTEFSPIVEGIARLRSTGSLPDSNLHRGDLSIYDYRDGWKWLDDRTRKVNIAVVNQAFTFPLHGTGSSRNRLFVLPTHSRKNWLHRIRSQAIRYVVTSPFMRSGFIEQRGSKDQPLLILRHVVQAQRNESSAMFLRINETTAQAVSIAYKTWYWNRRRGFVEPSGKFLLTVNGGAMLFELEPTEAEKNPGEVKGDENDRAKMVTFQLPEGTSVSDIGILYLDRPIRKLDVQSAVFIGGLAVHDQDGSLIWQPLQKERWNLMTTAIEELWMAQFPEMFQLVHVSPDRTNAWKREPAQRDFDQMKIFEVLGNGRDSGVEHGTKT